MATYAVVNTNKLEMENVSITDGKRNTKKGLSASILYSKQVVSFRLPSMAFPGGLLQREDSSNGSVSYSLIGSLKGCDPHGKARATGDDDMSKFYNFLLDLKEKIIKAATENSKKWFGKEKKEDSIRDSFNDRSILSVSSDKVGDEYVPNGKYPPSFRVKIPVYDGRISKDFEVVDSSARPIAVTLDSLRSLFPKGVKANLVVSGSIYIVDQSFGISWRVTMAQIFPASRVAATNVFEAVEDEEDESSPVEEQTVNVPVAENPPEESVPVPARKRRAAVSS
jgi:hypothetical protein